MPRFDLVIVGGGLVGAGLAAALRHSGLRIAVIDSRRPSSDDPRLFALNNGSCQFLDNLHLWPRLSAHASPIQQVHVTRHGHFGSVRLRCEDVGLRNLGHVIPARHIEAALNETLLSLPACTLFRPARLQSLDQDDRMVQLTILTEEGEVSLSSLVVIGADGTDSTVRSQLHIKTEVIDYEQSAIVTRTALKRSHHHVAHERFLADGAVAMLPLPGEECATIWTASNHAVSELMSFSDEEFLKRLQDAFGYRLGRLQGITQRHVFPLRLVRAEKMVEQNVFLLGNSAHTLHPIAAQGFNLAVYEVAVLAEAILEKLQNQKCFTKEDLPEISALIQKQQATSIGVSHRLSTLFSTDSFLGGWPLQLGMMGLDMIMPVKKKFIEAIMGRTGRVPGLLLSDFYEKNLSA
ncbi:2-octaprenyl-6-methoxyphenol hydroxylase [Aquicella siphonis]|uniref:2-octaprenyl-6-methoxyphenol hydroxylase n=1 Tax=Aquicella siphonis TaxID=254247 RepID=A0A5E4PKV9_9COXI|nr:FAD-dependent monooxygenase [Aquicella siphonis]VVC76846.1 2-octaprenyl-6-methoxyphenol hydroxylase [Aquicella siphonis]